MRLSKFRVTHYRNVHDSGWIDLAHTTALVGRNESGKTNLLTALGLLTAPGFEPVFTRVRDFPADRLRSEYADELPVVTTRWLLTDKERADLTAILPEAATIPFVEVERRYSGAPIVRFPDPEDAQPPAERAKELARRLEACLAEAAADKPPLEIALGRVVASSGEIEAGEEAWRAELRTALENLEAAASLTQVALSDEARASMDGLRELASPGADATPDRSAGERFVLEHLPAFVFVDQVPELDGQMDLRAFQTRIREGALQEGDFEFGLLLRMAGIDDAVLEEILSGDAELRRQAVGQAGAAVTRKIRQLWTDRPLKVRFYLDGDQLNTLVCDPTAFADIEVNLNQRSQGFRWFFSFFVILCASHDEGRGDALLLLDEPGLQLHPVGQRDLIQYLSGLSSPTLLTTQAPALQPEGPGTSVLQVTYDPEVGTRVAPAPPGALDQPAPAQARAESAAAPAEAMAEPGVSATAEPAAPARDEDELVDALFQAATEEPADPEPLVVTHTLEAAAEQMVRGLVGDGPLILVENISDLWYLRATSEQLVKDGLAGLPHDIVPVPAGGAAYLGILARLARQGNDQPIVVVGSRPPAEMEAVLSGLPRRALHSYVYMGAAHEDPQSGRFELEDLIEASTYERFVRVAYAEELKGKDLALDFGVRSQVGRYEQALGGMGLVYQRSRPAKFIANGSERNVAALLAGPTRPRFERLFELIAAAFEALPTADEPVDAVAPTADAPADAAAAAVALPALETDASPVAPALETDPVSAAASAEAGSDAAGQAGSDAPDQAGGDAADDGSDAVAGAGGDAPALAAAAPGLGDDADDGGLAEAETGVSDRAVDVEIDLNVDWD